MPTSKRYGRLVLQSENPTLAEYIVNCNWQDVLRRVVRMTLKVWPSMRRTVVRHQSVLGLGR